MQSYSKLTITFNSIKSMVLVELQKGQSAKFHKKLFKLLISLFKFRNNKYTFQGSYDLAQWLVLCFNSMVHDDFFSEIVLPLIAYISIVDDACDEKISQFSIDEMECHCRIFEGETVDASNPALKMGVYVYELIKDAKYKSIRIKVLEFLQIGTKLIERAKDECDNNGQLIDEKLQQFLEERRIDSMSSLFFTINNFFKGISENNICEHLKVYNELACDIISLFNDVASLAKDTNKVVNNYIILHQGLQDNLSYSELKNLSIEKFETSLNQILEMISKKLIQMQTIKSSKPSQSREFDSIDEVMNGYCTWCIISKRFSHANHLLSEYHEKKTMIDAVQVKPWADDDKFTYLDDIEVSMNKMLQ